MTTKFSQFSVGGLLLNSDIIVGLRSGSNYQFSVTGIGDSNGANLFTWSQGAGPNVNYINALNAITGNGPVLSAKGSDTNVNFGLQGQGAGYVDFLGTGAISLPDGTTAQQPAAIVGGFRYNSTIDLPEYYSSGATAWVSLGSSATSVTSVTASSPLASSGGLTPNITLASVVPLSLGGTNHALTASNGGILYSDATKVDILAGTATADQLLLSGSSGAPAWSTSTYPTTNAANTLLYASAANTMAALATANNGVLITSGAGVPSISSTLPAAVQGNITAVGALSAGSLATGFTTVTVPLGGTGNTTFTAYSVICAGTTATGVFQNVSGVGTSGQALLSNGAAALPSWQTLSTAVGAALTRTSDTNVTLTLGGSPTTALLAATSITAGWSGQLSLARGGSNADLSATVSNGGIVYSTATAMAILAGTATANQVLLSGSSTTPAWSTATYPATTTVNQLLYSSSANVIAGLATANSATLITSAGGVPSLSQTLPSAVQGNITSVSALASGSLTTGFTAVTVPIGGTGNTTFTAYSVICAGTTATGAFQNVSGLGSSGYVLTSNGAGALPTWQAGGGGGGGYTIVNQVTGSATLANGNIYMCDNGASLITFTLPVSAAVGDRYEIIGGSSGGWIVAQNASQQMHSNSTATTSGATGSFASSNAYNCITIYCNTTNDGFTVIADGALTAV